MLRSIPTIWAICPPRCRSWPYVEASSFQWTSFPRICDRCTFSIRREPASQRGRTLWYSSYTQEKDSLHTSASRRWPSVNIFWVITLIFFQRKQRFFRQPRTLLEISRQVFRYGFPLLLAINWAYSFEPVHQDSLPHITALHSPVARSANVEEFCRLSRLPVRWFCCSLLGREWTNINHRTHALSQV